MWDSHGKGFSNTTRKDQKSRELGKLSNFICNGDLRILNGWYENQTLDQTDIISRKILKTCLL